MNTTPLYREFSEIPARLFAIGDIHGCANEISILLDHLTGKLSLSAKDIVLFIGDYIDRGPDSKKVLDLLVRFKESFPQSIFLKGNHEDMLLGFLGFGGRDGASYLLNGGDTFFESYEIKIIPQAINPFELQQKLPAEHIKFLRGLDHYIIAGDWVFAHAGINPLRDLKHQTPTDLCWIRDEFIQNIHYFRRTVVFGHTPYEDVLFHLPYKIGIDTGLVYGNKLSCIEVIEKKIFQVEKGGTEVKESLFPESKVLL